MALTRWTFVGKVMSLLFNMLSRLIIAFLPRSKRLLISWLQSLSAVILEPNFLIHYGQESAYNVGGLGSIPGLGRSAGEGKKLPTPIFWPGELHGLYSPWAHRELDRTEQVSLSF